MYPSTCACRGRKGLGILCPVNHDGYMIITIKVFTQRTILSGETILSVRARTHTHARTHARTHTHTLAPAYTIQLYWLYTTNTQHKQITSRDFWQMKIAAQNEKYGRCVVSEIEMSWGLISKSVERVSVGEEKESRSKQRGQTRPKMRGNNNGKTGTRNREDENI